MSREIPARDRKRLNFSSLRDCYKLPCLDKRATDIIESLQNALVRILQLTAKPEKFFHGFTVCTIAFLCMTDNIYLSYITFVIYFLLCVFITIIIKKLLFFYLFGLEKMLPIRYITIKSKMHIDKKGVWLCCLTSTW